MAKKKSTTPTASAAAAPTLDPATAAAGDPTNTPELTTSQEPTDLETSFEEELEEFEDELETAGVGDDESNVAGQTIEGELEGESDGEAGGELEGELDGELEEELEGESEVELEGESETDGDGEGILLPPADHLPPDSTDPTLADPTLAEPSQADPSQAEEEPVIELTERQIGSAIGYAMGMNTGNAKDLFEKLDDSEKERIVKAIHGGSPDNVIRDVVTLYHQRKAKPKADKGPAPKPESTSSTTT